MPGKLLGKLLAMHCTAVRRRGAPSVASGVLPSSSAVASVAACSCVRFCSAKLQSIPINTAMLSDGRSLQ